MRIYGLFYVALLLGGHALLGQLPAPPADLEEKADALVRNFAEDGVFQGAVLVKSKANILFQRSYGMANLEWQTPITEMTRFRIGSLTKQFAAAAMLQLEEKGRLSVQDSVRKYYPEAPAEWDGVTIEHLLRHTSGIFNYTSLPGFDFRREMTAAEVVATVHDKPLEFVPGTKFSYSNTGYVLAGLIVERVTKMSWAAYVKENLLKKAGLADTGYERNVRVSERRASGYQGDTIRALHSDFIDMTVPHAAGAMYSTIGDFSRWLEALEGGEVISGASLARMMTPGLGGYGYGVGRGRTLGSEYYTHSGGIHGFTTQYYRFPAEGLTIVVFANLEGSPVGLIADRLFALAVGRSAAAAPVRKGMEWDREQMQAAAGRFVHSAGVTVELMLEEDGLVMRDSRFGPGLFPLYADGAAVLFPRLLAARLTLEKDGSGVARIRYRLGNNELVLEREGASSPAAAVMRLSPVAMRAGFTPLATQ